ncbi:uncharacterized protein LOC117558055 [Gymnodraco acuticeps]|uniref:Uncharacterized protein LOC117558055 n=1 Tax=Gymnodraco acuticeps TaxID=8218 RepID=A0A6P8VWH6_GYMAC|nr:uncharacterized protein LOC117558055 [Gymnodraco acuticeps]
METVLLIIIALSGLSAVSSHAERQYHFVSEAKTMSEAQRYCREKHTDLATVDSMEVVKLLNDMAGQHNQAAWIGLHDDRDTRRWSMSDPSFYGPGQTEFRPWRSGQPSNGHDEQCTLLNSDGTWVDNACNYVTWVICFDVTGPNAAFVITKSSMNWTDAQSYCRENHTDLASVRNQTEYQQIVDLLPEGGWYWIGLYRDSWKWSDGSNSSFKYWKENEPNYNALKVCVAAAFDNSGKWEDLDCGVEKPFICYGPVPVSMQVIKVRVKKPNGVDLNDQAFLDAMLVEAKKNLRAQGLDDNVQVAWRKQPDGQVFHEEEEKKRDELYLKVDALCPESYRVNSPDQIRLLAIADNFQRQYSLLYPDHKPLLLCPVNECGERNREETRMETVLLIIIALSGLSAVSSHAERQYHFVYEAKNMSEAQRYCREKHTDLATVDSMEVVKLLNNMAGQYKQSAWIGLHDDRDTWRWSMSDPSFYGSGEIEFRRWRTGQPSNGHDEQCTLLRSDGTWLDYDCNIAYRSVCFDVTGPNAAFVLIESPMNWTDAQSYCREHHTDLASVRNPAENQQIVDLLPEGGVSIGLYRDSWKWSDGSNSSFKYWKVNEPNYEVFKGLCRCSF